MLWHITLPLPRSPEFPDGSAQHGYHIMAPLDDGGRIDPAEWNVKRAQCHVRRFWHGEPDPSGQLAHRPGGAEGATWLIDYDRERSDGDEPGFCLGTHTFRLGDSVSIRDAGDTMHTFRVSFAGALLTESEGS